MARPRKTQSAYEEYVFHISAPSILYSFAIEHDRKVREWQPFSEDEHVQFETECLLPDRFKGRKGTAIIRPEPKLVEHKELAPDDPRRRRFGYIRATRSEFETVVWLPPPACWRLGEAIASGLARTMLTNGQVDVRSFNRITSISFYGQEFDPVEYVG